MSRTFDDGTHTYVKVNPNSLALLSAAERVAYLQWLSIIIVPYLSSTAPGRVRGTRHELESVTYAMAMQLRVVDCPVDVGACMQEYLGLMKALLEMAIAIQSPVCSPAHEEALEVLISDFRAKYKRYTAGIISGVNCKRSQYKALTSTAFMKFHMLLHFVKSRRMYGPTREHDTGKAYHGASTCATACNPAAITCLAFGCRSIRAHKQGDEESVQSNTNETRLSRHGPAWQAALEGQASIQG